MYTVTVIGLFFTGCKKREGGRKHTMPIKIFLGSVMLTIDVTVLKLSLNRKRRKLDMSVFSNISIFLKPSLRFASKQIFKCKYF